MERGAYYHVYNRGINSGAIFFEERNYRFFLQRYSKYLRDQVDTFAYCLLPNHFHFFLRTKPVAPEEAVPISTAFANLFNSYAKAINHAYDRTGSLFERPFKRCEVTSTAYAAHLIRYIHWNPELHDVANDFRTYIFSSYRSILHRSPTRLHCEKTLSFFGGREGFVASHNHKPFKVTKT